MSWKLRVLISAMLLTPAAVMGLGLGEIRLNSALNEPLSAEIDLVAATPEEVGALQAQLASAEVFQRYGLDRPAYLNSSSSASAAARTAAASCWCDPARRSANPSSRSS